MAVIAHAIRQGKEKRVRKIGDKIKAYLFVDKNQIRTIRISKKARKLDYKYINKQTKKTSSLSSGLICSFK